MHGDEGYPKAKRPVLGVRPFCAYTHGLYCLARILLPEDTFQALKMPEYKNSLPGFAMWRREHHDPDLPLCFRCPEGMELFNNIYPAPPAKLVLMPPAPDDKKPERFAHGVKWVDTYVNTP